MLLSWEDAELFFRLHRSLMCFVNERLGVIPGVSDPEAFGALAPEDRLAVREAFLTNEPIELIEAFVEKNPAKLTEDELAIVASWRHHVAGTFYIFRQLKNYMVFLSSADPPVAYGVVALTEPFEDLIGAALPRMVETMLLPFKDKIIYDGLLSDFNLSFGGGIKRMLNDSYRRAKERQGIVTVLPIEANEARSAQSAKAKRTTKAKKKRRTTARDDQLETDARSDRVYQFRITLQRVEPKIWRRIQVRDCTLDELHECIQTAMGWTNSHLHQFEINGQRCGDPELLEHGLDDFDYIDSTDTRLSDFVPYNGSRFSFLYEYDFGDCWEHEVLFEGYVPREKGQRYPRCVDGERACPPEDVGGVWGYAEYLEAIADPSHERHEEFLEWSGPFDPEAFDPKEATRAMRRGLPSWR